MIVRHLEFGDIDRVVERVRQRLARDAARCSLVNPRFNASTFADALEGVRTQTWVAEDEGDVVGHLYGAQLENVEYGRGAWVGPDGVSFDTPTILDALYAAAGATWISAGAIEHYAWIFDDATDTTPWYELGFARMHARGVIALDGRHEENWPLGYSVRRATPDDLAVTLELDQLIDEAQQRGPSFALVVASATRADEMLETIEDPDVAFYLVDYEGRAVAQCLTFGLDARRGSFDHSLHVSALSVRPDHEHRGVAQALVRHALNEAVDGRYHYAEVNWRVTNHRAAEFWRRFGFQSTYVRLHRTIGAG